jgi:predicted phage tail protein
MMRKVYLEGDLGDTFQRSFSVETDTIQGALRCAEANFSGFKKYLVDCQEQDIGFTIDVADNQVEEECQLLLPIKAGDITITPVPAGSKGIGKILAAMAIVYMMAVTGGWAAGATTSGTTGTLGTGTLKGVSIGTKALESGALIGGGSMGSQTILLSGIAAPPTSFSAAVAATATGSFGGLMAAGLAINLAMTGISEMMAPDPSTDSDQESSYMFNGAEQNVIEGDPVPVLYGHLRIPGQPISFDSISSSYNPITGNTTAGASDAATQGSAFSEDGSQQWLNYVSQITGYI